jgi:zinc protease
MLRRAARVVLGVVSCCLPVLVLAEPQAPAAAMRPVPQSAILLPSETQRVPVDSAITVGRLDNGLRYYIRANRRPENRAELRLVVNAGSVLEDDDQRGLAHVVEHMAFNGTKHFAKQEIGAFMESIGMRFGPSLNAFTSFDDTTFVMQVPTDKVGIIDRAFLVMEDWSQNLLFEPQEVDQERGVIIEEWRLRRGAGARMQDQVLPVLLKGSRYSERVPIGTRESLQTFPHARLTQFYKDWYRPDLMAVVAVGDFDPAVIERLIKEHFTRIPPAAVRRPRPSFDVPGSSGTSFAIVADKEIPAATIAIYNKLPAREQSTVSSYRQRIIDHLYAGMVNDRLAELSQKPNPPFVAANVERSIFVRTLETATLSAIVKPDGIEQAVDALLTESERVARYGFTPAEFDREKRNLLRVYEQAVTEKASQDSGSLADEYVRNFLVDESIPGIAWEYEQHQRGLPGITLAEVNALAREWNGDRNRVVVVFAPDQPGLTLPTEAKLASVMAAVDMKRIDPPVNAEHTSVLLPTLPEPGAVVSTKTVPDVGMTEWTLSNGVTVVLKPTTLKQDEVVFRAFSPGGTSLAPDRDYVAAMTAAQVMAAGGVGSFDATGLRNALSGKVAVVSPTIGDTREGMSGGGSVKDIETILQLVYLYFTSPRADASIFTVMTDQMRMLLVNRRVMPDAVFDEMVQTTMTQNHLRARPLSPEIVAEMDLAKSLAFYKDRFADASGFTFVFVGSLNLETLKPLVERYLGALPSLHRKETWKDVGIKPPRGIVERTVTKGIEPKGRVRLVFSGPFTWTASNRVALETLGEVLEGQLGLVLREEQSGTYGVQVNTETQRFPTPEYQISVDFGCDPARTDALVKTALGEVGKLRLDGPSSNYVADTRQALLRQWETNRQENLFLLDEVADSLEFGDDVRGIEDVPRLYRDLTAEVVRDAARQYLDTNNYVRVTLLPEKK